MASHWHTCPHCKVHFHTDAAQAAPRQCPACRQAIASSPTPVVAATGQRRPAARPLPPAPLISSATPPAGIPIQAARVSTPAAMPGWFYAQGKRKIGPVSLAQLRQLAQGGGLRAGDMVMQEGTGKWQLAWTVTGLFPTPPKPPVPAAHATNGAAPAPSNGRPMAAPPPLPPGWFYAQNKKKVGPLSWAQIQQLAASGAIKAADMVLPQGTGKWVAAGSLPALFPPPPSVAPVPPKPSPAPVPKPAEDLSDSLFNELAPAKKPSVAPAPEPSQSTLDAFFSSDDALALPLPPIPPRSRLRPAGLDACPHCQGTAYCGRKWDAAGIMECGPVCPTCRQKSGLDPTHGAAKVTCSFCAGKGSVAADEAPAEAEWSAAAIAWRLRGLASSDSGDYVPAIAAFTEALRLEPAFAEAYYDRGWALLATGQTDEGEADLAEAARLSEQFAAPGAPVQPPRRWFGLFGGKPPPPDS